MQELSIDTINYDTSINGAKLHVIALTKLNTGNSTNLSINFYNHITSTDLFYFPSVSPGGNDRMFSSKIWGAVQICCKRNKTAIF